MITLITMTQGNPHALKRTIENVVESFAGRVTEVIVGDLCPLLDDKAEITRQGYKGIESNQVVIRPYPINYIFLNGFGAMLNELSRDTVNNIILYMNVGEIVDSPVRFDALTMLPFNAWLFDHATDQHRWCRMYEKHRASWSGRIHEELIGAKRVCPEPIFRMADTDKDNDSPFKSWMYNDIKEIVYFYQYIRLVDDPGSRGATNAGWVTWAQTQRDYYMEQLAKRGERYRRFINGDAPGYIEQCKIDWPEAPEFVNTEMIHYQ